jgi:hypothetical protein
VVLEIISGRMPIDPTLPNRNAWNLCEWVSYNHSPLNSFKILFYLFIFTTIIFKLVMKKMYTILEIICSCYVISLGRSIHICVIKCN